MANTRHKFQDPKQFLSRLFHRTRPLPVDEEHSHKIHRSAIDYYGEDYMDKLLKVTGGRVLHDYVAPRFTLPKKYRK